MWVLAFVCLRDTAAKWSKGVYVYLPVCVCVCVCVLQVCVLYVCVCSAQRKGASVTGMNMKVTFAGVIMTHSTAIKSRREWPTQRFAGPARTPEPLPNDYDGH